MIELKDSQDIEGIHKTGKEVHRILHILKDAAIEGVNLLELDEICKNEIEKCGGTSVYVDYDPDGFGNGVFGHYVCLSVNEAVLHGVPFNYKLKKGDVLCIDLAFEIDEYVADSAITVIIGNKPTKQDKKMIEITKQALKIGIEKAQIGNTTGDISASIGLYAKKHGIKVNTEFGGHGVGFSMHEDPHIPNDGQFKKGFKLQDGLVIAIEPWFFTTTDKLVTGNDGWTLKSKDKSNGYHFEHTIAITKDGPVILTDGK